MPVTRLSEYKMTTRNWQEFAVTEDLMVIARTLGNGGVKRWAYHWVLVPEQPRLECDDSGVREFPGDF